MEVGLGVQSGRVACVGGRTWAQASPMSARLPCPGSTHYPRLFYFVDSINTENFTGTRRSLTPNSLCRGYERPMRTEAQRLEGTCPRPLLRDKPLPAGQSGFAGNAAASGEQMLPEAGMARGCFFSEIHRTVQLCPSVWATVPASFLPPHGHCPKAELWVPQRPRKLVPSSSIFWKR